MSVTFDAASGGNGVLRYAVDQVPVGLAFNAATRMVPGRFPPGQAGQVFTITCTATDHDGDEAEQTVVLRVRAARRG